MSLAFTTPLPDFSSLSTALSRAFILTATFFMFSRMSSTSSCTPSSVEYSCTTPSILASVMAAPGIDDSRMRRSALPRVWPKPRSIGSSETRARLVETGSTSMVRGFRRSVTACMCNYLLVSESVPPVEALRFANGRRNRRHGLLGVQLHDQVFVDVRQHLLALRHRLELALQA